MGNESICYTYITFRHTHAGKHNAQHLIFLRIAFDIFSSLTYILVFVFSWKSHYNHEIKFNSDKWSQIYKWWKTAVAHNASFDCVFVKEFEWFENSHIFRFMTDKLQNIPLSAWCMCCACIQNRFVQSFLYFKGTLLFCFMQMETGQSGNWNLSLSLK